MYTILITGANRGLGLGFVRHYAEQGMTIIATCREPDKATELQALAEQFSHIAIEALDICDYAAVIRLSEKYADYCIDILINNAGILVSVNTAYDAETWLKSLETNAVAPMILTQAFLPQVKRSAIHKVVFISSSYGSIELATAEGSIYYRSAKAALNMAVRRFALDYTYLEITAVCLCPGWVRTDMGGVNAELSVDDSIAAMVTTIAGLESEHHGQFLNQYGDFVPW
ncbi:SDR family oxidoreductase [Kistimonas scapharcae]